MVEAFLNGIINFFFWILGLLGNLLFNPIIWLLNSLMPDIGTFLQTTSDFFIDKVFPVICWLKLSFLGIIKMPGAFWSFIVLEITTAFIFDPLFRAVRLIYNIWQVYRGTQK